MIKVWEIRGKRGMGDLKNFKKTCFSLKVCCGHQETDGRALAPLYASEGPPLRPDQGHFSGPAQLAPLVPNQVPLQGQGQGTFSGQAQGPPPGPGQGPPPGPGQGPPPGPGQGPPPGPGQGPPPGPGQGPPPGPGQGPLPGPGQGPPQGPIPLPELDAFEESLKPDDHAGIVNNLIQMLGQNKLSHRC